MKIRTNVQFAHTATRFPYPTGFSKTQSLLFDQVIEWLNDTCFENPNWHGEDCYRDFDPGDVEVFRKIQELCRIENSSFYWVLLDGTKYRVGVVESAPSTMRARAVQNQKN